MCEPTTGLVYRRLPGSMTSGSDSMAGCEPTCSRGLYMRTLSQYKGRRALLPPVGWLVCWCLPALLLTCSRLAVKRT